MTPDDSSPLTDDLDDLTLHEPVTKENDMNEARASERADLVELQSMDCLRLAHEAGGRVTPKEAFLDGYPVLMTFTPEQLERFAALVIARLQGLSAAGAEPAATASRTVSVTDKSMLLQCAIFVASFAREPRDSQPVPTLAFWAREYVDRIFAASIHAPSVAESAKCASPDCIDGYVPSPPDGEPEPCRDCHAAAEGRV